ncbi:MAG TPA: YfhO family protein [Thermoanaerobaculia bacterium]
MSDTTETFSDEPFEPAVPETAPEVGVVAEPEAVPVLPLVDDRPVPKRHDHLAILFLILLPTAFFADVLFGVNQFYMRDLTRYYYPAKQVVRTIALGGEFPLWNRYFSAGQPMAANPEHETFYPLTWLILLPNYDLGYRLHILIHLYIALLGMYALLRSLELRPPAAVFGALSFGLGGLFLSYVNLLPIMFCAAWLPLTCLYTRKFLFKPSIRDFGIASLFLGLQCLVGEPTTVVQTGFILGMYALYRGWYSTPRVAKMITNVLWIGAMTAMAIAVGAAQMIPAADHVTDSARSRVFDFSLVSAWSFPWAKLTEVIYPNFLGYMSIKQVMWYWAGGLYPGMGSPFLFNIYCGLLVTALAIAGGFVHARGGRFVLILVLFSLLIALGGNTPLLRALYDAGIATSIRYPEKFILIGVFAIIVFASQMLQRMLDGDKAVRDSALGFVLAVTLVATVIAIFTFFPIYGKTFSKLWGLTPGGGATKMIGLSAGGWIAAAARGAALLFLLWSVRVLKRRIWLALALLFVCFDLGPVVHQLNPRMPQEFFTVQPASAADLPPNRHQYRVFHESDWYGQEEVAKKFFSTGDAVYWIVRNGVYPMTPAGHGIATVMERDYDKTALLPTIDLVESVWDVKRSGRKDWWQPFTAMSNSWYRGIYRPFDAEWKRTGGRMKKAKPIQFVRIDPNPRYYFADQLVTIKDRKDFVDKLIKNNYSKRVAFLTRPTFVPADGKVLGWRETSNTAVIDVESRGRGFLVMSVTPHKYWEVTVSGRRVEPVVTNIGFQGIDIPAGRHRILMRYRNPLVERGVLISIISIVILGALTLVRRRQSILTEA